MCPCPMTGCWLWIGAMNCKGYGSHGRRAPYSGSQLTHRFTYECLIGRVPDGDELDHRVCSIRSCANPLHMKPCSHAENVSRATRKTHCKYGHPLSGVNEMLTKEGRRCRECSSRESRERRAREVRPPAKDRKKSHCKYGHALTDDNRLPTKQGSRCLACARARPVLRPALPRPVKTHCKYGHLKVARGNKMACPACLLRTNREWARRHAKECSQGRGTTAVTHPR